MSLLHRRSHKEHGSAAAGTATRVAPAQPSGEVAALLSELRSGGDQESRIHAARALGKSGSPQAVPALAGCLGESDERLRRAAVDALIRIGGEAQAAVERLLVSGSEPQAADIVATMDGALIGWEGHPEAARFVAGAVRALYLHGDVKGCVTLLGRLIQLGVEPSAGRAMQVLLAFDRGDMRTVRDLIVRLDS